MSAAELNALERDVEQARARFADDLPRLRSPANLTRLKHDLWADVRETKDEVVDKAKDAAQDGAQRLVAEGCDARCEGVVRANPKGRGKSSRASSANSVASSNVMAELTNGAATAPPRPRERDPA
jgi:hypothetical protein